METSDAQESGAGIFRFADFELRTLPYELMRDGESVDLAPQPLRLLELLVRHPGELVSREKIRQALWGEDTHVDFDRGINFNIRQIRRELGDDPHRPRFVETVPRSGYRFIAAAHAGAASAATTTARSLLEESSLDLPVAQPLPRGVARGWWLWPLAATLFLALLLSLFWALPAAQQPEISVSELEMADEPNDRRDYVRGRLLLDKNNPPARREVLRAFGRAVEQDPAWAPARAGLARAHLHQDHFEEARKAAAAALQLDPFQPEARYVRAVLRFGLDLRWEEAEEDLLVALRAEDDIPEAHVLYAVLLSAMGRGGEATNLLEEAVDRLPLDATVVQGLALSLFLERRYPATIQWARRGLELAPGSFLLYRILINSLAFEGRQEEVRVAANQYLEPYGWSPYIVKTMGDWWRINLENARLSKPGPFATYHATRASWLLALGRQDEAMEELEQACADKCVLDLALLSVDPRFDPLRRDPRFHEVLTCLPVQGGPANQGQLASR